MVNEWFSSSKEEQYHVYPSPFSQDGEKKSRPELSISARHGRSFINYELFVWIVYGTLTALAVLDRFITNYWPRETYSIGSGTAGSDFVGDAFFQLKEGPWTVKFYDLMARASGRYCIVALNLVFFSMCHTTYAWLSESWMARNVIDMTDYKEANRRLHKWNGIGIVIMTLLHVWSVLFPCIVHGWKAQVVLGNFEWILSERGPSSFKDINVDTKTMSLQGDDVFRIVEMTLLLAVLLPLTVRWLSTRWHLGIHLHSLIAVMYFIDIVRRHTHPHSWILNTPFFVHWIADLIVGVYWRRVSPDITRMALSDDYMLLFWNQTKRSNTIGPKYFLQLKDSSMLERAHVFTCFENRSGLDIAGGRQWSVCLLIRVYNKNRRPRLGKSDNVSHTKRVAESTDLDIWTWGPFLGGMSDAVRVSMTKCGNMTLVAGGSAAGYVIDAIQWHHLKETCENLTVLYTTRDVELFHWVVKVIAPLVCGMPAANCSVLVALTNGGAGKLEEEVVVAKRKEIDNAYGQTPASESFAETCTESGCGESRSFSESNTPLRLQPGRIMFADEIPCKSTVYFQGSGGLQTAVENGARSQHSTFVAGPSYENSNDQKSAFLQKLKRAKRSLSSSSV